MMNVQDKYVDSTIVPKISAEKQIPEYRRRNQMM